MAALRYALSKNVAEVINQSLLNFKLFFALSFLTRKTGQCTTWGRPAP